MKIISEIPHLIHAQSLAFDAPPTVVKLCKIVSKQASSDLLQQGIPNYPINIYILK